MVKNTKYGDEISEEKEISQDYEMKKKRLQLMFGDPNLTIEDIVTPIGEKELEEEVKRLKEEKEQLLRKDDKNVGIGEGGEEEQGGIRGGDEGDAEDEAAAGWRY